MVRDAPDKKKFIFKDFSAIFLSTSEKEAFDWIDMILF